MTRRRRCASVAGAMNGRLTVAAALVAASLLCISAASASAEYYGGGPMTIADGSWTSSAIPIARGGVIQDVSVHLWGVDHDFPEDLDVLLVGPGGRSVMLMSDVPAGEWGDFDITIDDE